MPVGLVHASWGGSAIEPWIGEAGVRTLGGDYIAKIDLLHLFATDEAAANQRFGRLWEDWWRAHGAAAGEPWKPEDTGAWTDVPGLRNWKTWGVPELATHRRNGLVPALVRADGRAGRRRSHARAWRDRRSRRDLGQRSCHPQHVRLGNAAHVCASRGRLARWRQRPRRECPQHVGRGWHARARRHDRADPGRRHEDPARRSVELSHRSAGDGTTAARAVGDDLGPDDDVQRDDRADWSVQSARSGVVPGRDQRGCGGRLRQAARRPDDELARAVRR